MCIAAPSLNLTAEEKRVFGRLFQQADTEGIGVVTGEVAVKFFEKTRLEPRILGEVRFILQEMAGGKDDFVPRKLYLY